MITKEDIVHLSELARLDLTPEEITALQADTANILDYVGEITRFSGSTPDSQIPLNHNVLREDVARTSDSVHYEKRESLLEALPRREGDMAVERTIIQKDE